MADPVPLFSAAEPTFAVGRALCRSLLDSSAKIDCAFAANDLLGVGAVLHCIEAGLSLPGDLALCGFNDLPISREIGGGLTTVHSPRREIGRETARLFLALDEDGATREARVRRVDCHIVQRATT